MKSLNSMDLSNNDIVKSFTEPMGESKVVSAPPHSDAYDCRFTGEDTGVSGRMKKLYADPAQGE